MKKLMALSLSAFMIFSVAACGGGTADTSAAASEETTSAAAESESPSASAAESEAPTEAETAAAADTDAATVEITDVHGTVAVPVNPQRVISLDNRTYDTLNAWGVKLLAAPKGVMPADSPYVTDEEVLDIGDHREPNLEIIAAADPDLVIVGQRFASYYEDIVALVPNAAVIDLNFDVSETAESPGTNFVNGFVDTTNSLGKIFAKETEATQIVDDFNASIEAVKAAYDGESTVMSVIVSGGNIGYSAPGTGRVWGPMYEIFAWVPALAVDNTTSDHQGDEINVEAIAQSNPDWMLVLDRDAAVSGTDAIPAQDVIDNSPALQNTTAIKAGNIVYAPNDTYTNESIQTYITLFNNIAEAFAK